jgi:hypothetical protein
MTPCLFTMESTPISGTAATFNGEADAAANAGLRVRVDKRRILLYDDSCQRGDTVVPQPARRHACTRSVYHTMFKLASVDLVPKLDPMSPGPSARPSAAARSSRIAPQCTPLTRYPHGSVHMRSLEAGPLWYSCSNEMRLTNTFIDSHPKHKTQRLAHGATSLRNHGGGVRTSTCVY